MQQMFRYALSRTPKRVVIFLLGAMCAVHTLYAQQATMLEEKASIVASLFRSDPGDYSKYFSERFLSQVPPAQLTAIFGGLYGEYGSVTRRQQVETDSEYSTKYTFALEKGYIVEVTIVVAPKFPHLIEGLWVGTPVKASGNLESITKDIKELPGDAALLIVPLEPNARPLASLNPRKQFAIGSAFKLFILSELIRSIKAGEREWEDVVRLKEEYMSLPSGIIQTWPIGAPVTLHTLATLMISRSDNTATDHLLMELGRRRVEAMLPVTGHAMPEKNTPFLTTLELFKMKGEATHSNAEEYISKNGEERRAYLESTIRKYSREDIHFDPSGGPLYINELEWFASVTDMCNVMAWIKGETESGKAAMARGALAVNPGLNLSGEQWQYIGFKGGSEPGVLNLTYLLQSAATGKWYALAASWNDTEDVVDEGKFFGLITRAVELIEPDTE